ncbi:MAG: PAS domain-containing protein [bacterium]|nr:PAS domain-containing protein [bacterium]
MIAICAWCGFDMGTIGADGGGRGPITHGLCDSCHRKLIANYTQSFRDFLDHLPVPILLLEPGVTVLTANRRARALLGKELPEIEGRRGGDVIECVHARTPEGCGQTIHCRGCAIRRTVTETFATGVSRMGVPTYPDIATRSGARRIRFRITTEKVNEFVLLRIDEVEPADAPEADPPAVP